MAWRGSKERRRQCFGSGERGGWATRGSDAYSVVSPSLRTFEMLLISPDESAIILPLQGPVLPQALPAPPPSSSLTTLRSRQANLFPTIAAPREWGVLIFWSQGQKRCGVPSPPFPFSSFPYGGKPAQRREFDQLDDHESVHSGNLAIFDRWHCGVLRLGNSWQTSGREGATRTAPGASKRSGMARRSKFATIY